MPAKETESREGPRPAWVEGWGIELRVWLERAGQSILGPGRVDLLEAIERSRSISAAARQLGMSYRHAWELVQAINEAAGEPLVSASTGGQQGGGAQVTPLGRSAIVLFRAVQSHLQQAALGLLPRLGRQAPSTTLHVAAAVSLEEVVGQLLIDFALLLPGVRPRVVYGASDELADQLLAGAPGDVFLTADTVQVERLQAAGLVEPGQQVTLAENGLTAIGAATGQLAVRRAADLVRGDWRIALAEPSCPLGRYTRAYLESLGLYDRVSQRTTWVDNARAAVTAVRAGRAEAALVYASDALHAEGCRPLFHARRLPAPIRYRGAVVRCGQQPAAALRLLEFLSSARSARCFRRCGFRVVRGRS